MGEHRAVGVDIIRQLAEYFLVDGVYLPGIRAHGVAAQKKPVTVRLGIACKGNGQTQQPAIVVPPGVKAAPLPGKEVSKAGLI